MLLAVEDSGRGHPSEDLPHVFERFYRSATTGGSGLGLAIVDALVRAQHGSIDVDSQLGRGTTFAIHLPAAAPASSETPDLQLASAR